MSHCAEVVKACNMSEEELSRFIINATEEVFSTMVFLEITDCYPLKEPVTSFHCSLSSMVGLAGTYSGILSLHCPQALALRITSSMLDMEVAEVGADVHDALGEIANMLGGHVKQVLSKGGLDINLSIPTVIGGDVYTINSLQQNDTVLIPFACEGDHFLVGLSLR